MDSLKRVLLFPCGLTILAASFLFLSVIGIKDLSAQAFSVVHAFTSSPNDGSNPFGGLTSDRVGSVYGITYSGGQHGRGVVYKIDQFGNETILHNLTNHDGCCSESGLLLDRAGNLYGTTTGDAAGGEGGVFHLYPSGKFGLLHTFGSDGANPQSTLIRGPGGLLYGTAIYGGFMENGIIFSINPKTRIYTVLHEFIGSDGGNPLGNLVFDHEGNLYGATLAGGDFGHGVVYKLDPSGAITVLHNFIIDWVDGASPLGGLIMGHNGVLYGTTSQGGQFGFGTIFSITLDGQESVLYSFESSPDGAEPVGGVIQDHFGNFYGTTFSGGTLGQGTVYKFDTSGTLTVIHSFTWGADGDGPEPGLTPDGLGNLYGTADKGGDSNCNCGVVFKITP